jgi:hypothetical protein
MTLRHFFRALALAGAVIVLFNIYLAFTFDSLPRLIIRQLRLPTEIDMLFLGNSLMNRALDEKTFSNSWPGPATAPPLFNACLPASSPVEHYLFAREAFRDHPSIKYVVYDFYDRQLTETPVGSWDRLVGGTAMAYYIEPDIARALYFPDSLYGQARFSLVSLIPMLRERFSLWSHIENQRRRMQQAGMPPMVNKGALVSVFHELGYPEKTQFIRDCDSVVRSSSDFTPAVDRLFELAAGKGSAVYVIDMPMQSNHRQFYYSSFSWIHYRDYIKNKLKARGIAFINAEDWVQDADFLDDIHLNNAGATIFSKRLAETLAEQIKP